MANEARQVLDSDIGAEGDIFPIMKWSGAHLTAITPEPGVGYLELDTPEGTVRCVPGDWIVKHDDGFRRLTAAEAVAEGITT